VRLEHQFSVPAPPEAVWAAVIDPERVAPCMPGATLTEVDGAEFSGGVKVKLGPVSLLYKGSGQFLETDEQARRVVIKAAGKDSRGNGTASATVTVTLTEDNGGTKGTVVTDLTVTGKPAQFGRGMIVEVGGKILDTFASCLATKLDVGATNGTTEDKPKPATTRRTRAKVTEPVPDADAASSDADTDGPDEPPPPVKPKPATRRRTTASKATTRATTTSVPAEDQETPSPEPPSANGTPSVNGVVATPEPRLQLVEEPAAKPAPRPVVEAEPIDLLDYAGPSLVKRVVPVVLGLIVLILLIRRLRRS